MLSELRTFTPPVSIVASGHSPIALEIIVKHVFVQLAIWLTTAGDWGLTVLFDRSFLWTIPRQVARFVTVVAVSIFMIAIYVCLKETVYLLLLVLYLLRLLLAVSDVEFIQVESKLHSADKA